MTLADIQSNFFASLIDPAAVLRAVAEHGLATKGGRVVEALDMEPELEELTEPDSRVAVVQAQEKFLAD